MMSAQHSFGISILSPLYNLLTVLLNRHTIHHVLGLFEALIFLMNGFASRYVSLSDNEKTDYKARELKSVHVDAVGTHLRLTFHRNYASPHNLYNQVKTALRLEPVQNFMFKFSLLDFNL